MRLLSLLGSTGSIGKNCLAVARHLGPENVRVVALAARSNIELLEQQIKEFQPQLVAVYEKEQARALQQRFPHITVMEGMEGLEAVSTHPASNFVVAAISGVIGLTPTVAAIRARKNIGFANKEVLVAGGELVTRLVRQHQISLIPIDSELTALFQCLKGEPTETIKRLLITASGGPFRTHSSEELDHVTVDHALKHPNYRMGSKVTIDSSTLMNKGLEMIEAHWLFQVPLEKIEVLVHPEQIIHSMVEFVDHSTLAQMGDTDMRIPIQYALTYPNRQPCGLPSFDFTKHGNLHFFSPDLNKFRCLKLAYDALHAGTSFPCYMNAANEVLVHRFLNREIGWKEIGTRLETLLAHHSPHPLESLDDLFHIDGLARREAYAS